MAYKRQAQWVSFLPTLGARTWSTSVLYLHPDRLLAEPHMELKYHLGGPGPKSPTHKTVGQDQTFSPSGVFQGACYLGCPSLSLAPFFMLPTTLISSTGGPIQPEFPAA